jgi:pyruvate/2-oxoglutarate/acetoin dehydrogenase E1 component
VSAATDSVTGSVATGTEQVDLTAPLPAERDAGARSSGEQAGEDVRTLTYAEAVREAMAEAMTADERVFLLGEDVGVYGGAFGVSGDLFHRFGAERVRDTPISELGFVGAAVGAAMAGMRPIVEIQFSDFMAQAMDQIVNQAAKIHYMLGGAVSVPMVLRAPLGSGTGAAAQHSQSLEAWYAHVPGLKVVMPSTPADAKGLLLAAIDDPNPVIVLEHKLLYRTSGPVPEGPYRTPIGVSEVRRAGRDLTVVATGVMVSRALEAAEQLAALGIEAEVVDPRTLTPLDAEPILASVRRTGRVLLTQEAPGHGGYMSEVAARITESDALFHLLAPVRRLCGLDVPIPYAPQLEVAAVPQVADVVAAARDLVERS